MAGSIRKRSKGSWELKVELGKDPVTGRRVRRYENFKGTRRDAEQRLTHLLLERDTGIDIAPNRLTVATYLERWLRDYAFSNVAPSSY